MGAQREKPCSPLAYERAALPAQASLGRKRCVRAHYLGVQYLPLWQVLAGRGGGGGLEHRRAGLGSAQGLSNVLGWDGGLHRSGFI